MLAPNNFRKPMHRCCLLPPSLADCNRRATGLYKCQGQPCTCIATGMKRNSRRLFYINLGDWTWWAWTITTALLIVGLAGYSPGFIGAMVVTAVQGLVLLVRERSPAAFSVQLRAAYLIL